MAITQINCGIHHPQFPSHPIQRIIGSLLSFIYLLSFSLSDGSNHSGIIRQKGKEHLHGQCKRQGVSHEQSGTGAGGFVQSGNERYSSEEHRVRTQRRVSQFDLMKIT